MTIRQRTEDHAPSTLSDPIAHLLAKAKIHRPLKTAVVNPLDVASLSGALDATRQGLISPSLIGEEEAIRSLATQHHLDLSPATILAAPDALSATHQAIELVHQGKIEAIMKGYLHTHELMQPIVAKDTGLRTSRRMSHCFMIATSAYPKPLFITDAALAIRPTLEQKQSIVQNAIDLAIACGVKRPKVAIVSAVETVEAILPSTIDAAALSKMADRGQIKGGLVDGPLGFDNAISPKAAKTKGLSSPVAGDADIIVVPDLETGNCLYKQMRYLSGAQSAGIVVGGQVPIILTSRAADDLTRTASSALALLVARSQPSTPHP